MSVIITQLVATAIIVGVFALVVSQQRTMWEEARVALTTDDAGTDLLVSMQRARDRAAHRGQLVCLGLMLAVILVPLVVVTLDARARWGVPGAKLTTIAGDVLSASFVPYLVLWAVPGVTLAALLPRAVGHACGLWAAHREARRVVSAGRADQGVARAQRALAVPWSFVGVQVVATLTALLALGFAVPLVAALVMGASMAISSSQPGSKTM